MLFLQSLTQHGFSRNRNIRKEDIKKVLVLSIWGKIYWLTYMGGGRNGKSADNTNGYNITYLEGKINDFCAN